MNILQICASYLEKSGGVSLHAHDLAESLVKFFPDDIAIHVICNEPEKKGLPSPEINPSVVTTITTNNGPTDNVLIKDGHGDRLIIWKVPTKQIKQFDGLRFFNDDVIAYALKKLTHRDINLIHVHDWDSLHIGLTLSAAWDIPLVMTIHRAPEKWYPGKLRSFPKDAYLEFIKNSSAVTEFIVPSEASKKVLHDQEINNVTVIPHGITKYLGNMEPKEKYLDDYGIPHNKKIILCPVRAESTKNPDVLVLAASIINANYPKEELVYVFLSKWEGKEYEIGTEVLRNMASIYDLEEGKNVFFLPQIEWGEPLASLIKFSFIVVIPSLHESFGLSVLDSFICKIPVIARNSMALPEIIDNERNGLLFTNEKDLASHMGCLLENPEFYKKLVENAYSDVINHFSAQRMAEEYKNLYDKVLAH